MSRSNLEKHGVAHFLIQWDNICAWCCPLVDDGYKRALQSPRQAKVAIFIGDGQTVLVWSVFVAFAGAGPCWTLPRC